MSPAAEAAYHAGAMPEGHIIHRLAREIRSTFGTSAVRASSPQGRFASGAAMIDGETLHRSDAWGKYLFVEFTGSHILHIHLGLIGKLRRRPTPPPPPTDTVRLRLEGAGATWDLTGPARCELITPAERDEIVATLGPDPLRRGSRLDGMRTRIRASQTPIGALLLDQRVVAGIGNVYRAEILFRCGIDPRRPGSSLSDEELDAIWDDAVNLMRIGTRLGRIVTTEPAEIGRTPGRMRDDERLYVYHREHCRRCGTAIETATLGGRRIQFCPLHQH